MSKPTQNTFTNGLVMDLNPLSTPNNVMTNALNATLITMNGNEMILQNDMGNGRVETAYLPEGYVPLGTAELGGIIYIVSYNPLINQCQIGSFPSPERNITSEENSQSTITINQDSFIGSNGTIKTALMKMEFNNTILNPGDKFIVYNSSTSIKDNFNELSDDSDSFPRKIIKLRLATIDTDNNITYLEDLKKYNIDNSFNYIIPQLQKDQEGNITNLDSYRSLVSSAYQIFSSKVPGKLCIIAQLETIDSFSTTWKIVETDDSDTNIIYKIQYGFNWECDDDDNHQINIVGIKQSIRNIEKDQETLVQSQLYTEISDISYSDNIRSITTESQPILINKNELLNNDKYQEHFEFIPRMSYGYLDWLKQDGIIDFKNIGTGKIELSEYRYYVENNDVILNWGLDAYPEPNKEISGVDIFFIRYDQAITNNYDISSCPVYSINNQSSYSGHFSNIIRLIDTSSTNNQTYDIYKNQLYLLLFRVRQTDSGVENSQYYRYYTRWMYTINDSYLFNQYYLSNNYLDYDDLKPSVTIKLNAQTNNNIQTDTSDYYPNLFSESSIEDLYKTLGYRRYDINGKIEVKLDTELQNNYNNVFSLDNSMITLSTQFINKSITTENASIISEEENDDSSIYQEILPYISDSSDSVDVSTYPINNAENNWQQYYDYFVANISNNTSKTFDINIKGRMFNKIGTTMESSYISAPNTVAPLIYNKSTASNNGLSFQNFNGVSKGFFEFDKVGYFGGTEKAGHHSHMQAGLLSIKSSGYDNGILGSNAYGIISGTDYNYYLNQGDGKDYDIISIPTVYQDIFTTVSGTIVPVIWGYGKAYQNADMYSGIDTNGFSITTNWAYNPLDRNRLEQSQYQHDLQNGLDGTNLDDNNPMCCTFFVKTDNNDYYEPINNHMYLKKASQFLNTNLSNDVVEYGTNIHTIGDVLYSFYSQIYKLYSGQSASSYMYIPKYIKYCSPYTETWKQTIKATCSIPSQGENGYEGFILINNVPINKQSDITIINNNINNWIGNGKLISNTSNKNIQVTVSTTTLTTDINYSKTIDSPLLNIYENAKSNDFDYIFIFTDGSIKFGKNISNINANSFYWCDGNYIINNIKKLDENTKIYTVKDITCNDSTGIIYSTRNNKIVSINNLYSFLKNEDGNMIISYASYQKGNTYSLKFSAAGTTDPGVRELPATFALNSDFKII